MNSQSAPERVLLVSMPFGALERPALSLGLLKAHCRRLEVPCETLYLTFRFADRIGLGDYLWLCSDEVPYTAFAGEWIFASALYGLRPYSDAAYIDEILRRTWRLDSAALARLERVRAKVEPFLEDCLETIPWNEFTFVGFTSVFQQNLASLALAARVKRAHPQLTISFGGSNWEEVMGVALQKQFPFVDLVFSGEADESFPTVLKARREGRGMQGLRGVTASASNGLAALAKAETIRDMDSVPVPDFDDFFEQLRVSQAARSITPTLLAETARGCWWGERSHCTFCGLNGATMAFRSKSPDRVVDEFTHLRDRYGSRTVSVVDDILDMAYFRTVLPRLAAARLGLDFFWEIKANLTHEHVRLLRDAGVRSVQPGIESFSDHVLKLMGKGTTAFRNIELMKWCKEYGVKPYWNLLYGFPGESAADYEQTVALMRAMWHLDPPTGYGPIRMDRFSPYHINPASFGMKNVRPMAPFTFLYPFDRKTQMNISYYFDFDHEDGRADDEFARDAISLLREWRADGNRGMLEQRVGESGEVKILDTRRERLHAPVCATLDGWKAAVFLACDRGRSLPELAALPVVREANVEQSEIAGFLGRCVEHELMVTSQRSWLNVAVHVPAREAPEQEAAVVSGVSVAGLTHIIDAASQPA
jgi:ribosomal peptide maturation radical SAM protein 1